MKEWSKSESDKSDLIPARTLVLSGLFVGCILAALILTLIPRTSGASSSQTQTSETTCDE